MNALTEAREAVEGALSAATADSGVKVHTLPPTAVQPPCVVILPGSPWITPRGHVSLEVTAYANAAQGQGSGIARLEELVTFVRDALNSAGLPTGDVDAPINDTNAGVLSAAMPITVRIC